MTPLDRRRPGLRAIPAAPLPAAAGSIPGQLYSAGYLLSESVIGRHRSRSRPLSARALMPAIGRSNPPALRAQCRTGVGPASPPGPACAGGTWPGRATVTVRCATVTVRWWWRWRGGVVVAAAAAADASISGERPFKARARGFEASIDQGSKARQAQAHLRLRCAGALSSRPSKARAGGLDGAQGRPHWQPGRPPRIEDSSRAVGRESEAPLRQVRVSPAVRNLQSW